MLGLTKLKMYRGAFKEAGCLVNPVPKAVFPISGPALLPLIITA